MIFMLSDADAAAVEGTPAELMDVFKPEGVLRILGAMSSISSRGRDRPASRLQNLPSERVRSQGNWRLRSAHG